MCGTGVSPVSYTWVTENRLTCVQSGDPNSPADGDTKVEFVYDYMGRRVEKQVSEHNGTSWSVSDRRRFVYSDWLPVLELDVNASGTVTGVAKKYTWGLDLAVHNQSPERERGVTIDSAGGIGGLLPAGRVTHPLRSKGWRRDPRHGSSSEATQSRQNPSIAASVPLHRSLPPAPRLQSLRKSPRAACTADGRCRMLRPLAPAATSRWRRVSFTGCAHRKAER